MITTTPYCELSDIKSLLGLRSNTDDAWLVSMINQAQAVIDGEIGYSFSTDGSVNSPTTKLYDGTDSNTLFTGFIQQIVQVTRKSYSAAVDASGYFVVATQPEIDITQDCVVGPATEQRHWKIQRLSGSTFDKGIQNIKVVGIFGPGDCPPDITRACARIVGHWYRMRDTAYADTLAEQGNVRQKYTKKLPDDVVEILDNYRLRWFRSV